MQTKIRKIKKTDAQTLVQKMCFTSQPLDGFTCKKVCERNPLADSCCFNALV